MRELPHFISNVLPLAGVRSGSQRQKRAAAPSWRMGDASASRDTWRRGGSSSAEEATHVGMASNPSAGRLMDSGAAQMGHSPSLGALTGASLLNPTPFAAHNGADFLPIFFTLCTAQEIATRLLLPVYPLELTEPFAPHCRPGRRPEACQREQSSARPA